MDKERLDKWLSVVGHVAVIIGLIVVAFELRQGAAVANGELTTQFMTNWQELDRSRQDPSFAEIYAKAIEDPGNLTLVEKVRLDGYYSVVMDQMELARMLVDLDLFESTYEEILRVNVRIFFATFYSHAWWKSYSPAAHPTTIAIVNDELGRLSIDGEGKRFESISNSLRELSGDRSLKAVTD